MALTFGCSSTLYKQWLPIIPSKWYHLCLLLHLSAPPSVTRVTAVLAHSSGELLLLGTEGGHVFIVEVPGFRELEERNISLDQVASRSAKYNTQHIMYSFKLCVHSGKSITATKDPEGDKWINASVIFVMNLHQLGEICCLLLRLISFKLDYNHFDSKL